MNTVVVTGRTVTLSPGCLRGLRSEARRLAEAVERPVGVAQLLGLVLDRGNVFDVAEDFYAHSPVARRKQRAAQRAARQEQRRKEASVRAEHAQEVRVGRSLILEAYRSLIAAHQVIGPTERACGVLAKQLGIPTWRLPFEYRPRQWLKAPRRGWWYKAHPKGTVSVLDSGWPGAGPIGKERDRLEAAGARRFARDVEIERARLMRLMRQRGLQSLAECCPKHGKPIYQCPCDPHVRNHRRGNVTTVEGNYRDRLLEKILGPQSDRRSA